MIDFKYLGHSLFPQEVKANTYYCNNCECKFWYFEETDSYLVKIADGLWDSGISCNEAVIKKIIE